MGSLARQSAKGDGIDSVALRVMKQLLPAQGSALVETLRQQLDGVPDGHRQLLLLDAAADLHHAPRAVHGDAVGAAGDDVFDLVIEDAPGDVGVAGEPARSPQGHRN